MRSSPERRPRSDRSPRHVRGRAPRRPLPVPRGRNTRWLTSTFVSTFIATFASTSIAIVAALLGVCLSVGIAVYLLLLWVSGWS